MAPRKVCFSIAVSKPEKLEELPGALEATASLTQWAACPEAGFEVHAITDGGAANPEVTVDSLRQRFMPVLNRADVIDHLIVHFAGHGVAKGGVEDQVLLLTHWYRRPAEAILLSRFMRMLQFYQVKRVSLFVDACRSLSNVDTDDVQGDGILDKPDEDPREFRQDRFRATVHGSPAFMVKDVTGQGPSRCLFSTVLVKALCGAYPEAVDTRGADRVVASAKITTALETHVPAEARKHGIKATPSAQPGFITPDDVYTRLPIAFLPPDLPAPPPPAPPPRVTRGPTRGPTRGIPKAGPRHDGPPSFDEIAAEERRLDAVIGSAAAEYAREARPTHFESGAGCAVIGARVSEAVVTRPVQLAGAEDRGLATWWRLEDRSGGGISVRGPASVLMQLADSGSWIGAAVVPGKIVTFTVTPPGAASVIYRPVMGFVPDDAIAQASSRSEEIVGRLRAGTLTGNDALDVAVTIRTDKHLDPVLGAVAAYLYDAIGDRDNIRRIACFYAAAGEPIPFDVAMLADLRGTRDNGRLTVAVPPVPKRAALTRAEAQHPSYFQETYAVTGTVAGGFPWLRQGWALLDTVGLPVAPGVVELATTPRILQPSPFTTLMPDAGSRLAQLITAGEV